MLRRMQVSLDGLLQQLERHRLESEIVLIDWNPPQDKPLLKDIINRPDRNRYCTIRTIVVEPSIHYRFKYSDRISMNVVTAWNCGIRRARGKWVLPGAIDLLYTNELMSYIAQKKLESDARYRIDRCDVDKKVLDYDSLDEQIAFCRDHIIHVNEIGAEFDRGKLPHLHTNASGDFQLMSRQNWHRLRGYREDNSLSSYSDGLLSFASYAAGVREVMLREPLRLYHIDHSGKFSDREVGGGLPFENRLRYRFLPRKLNDFIVRCVRILLTTFGYQLKGSENGIPALHYAVYRKMAKDMIAGKRSYIINDENWGLGEDVLTEYVINAAEWDRDNEQN